MMNQAERSDAVVCILLIFSDIAASLIFIFFLNLSHSFVLMMSSSTFIQIIWVLGSHLELFVMVDFPGDADMQRSPSPAFLGKTNKCRHDLKGIKTKQFHR